VPSGQNAKNPVPGGGGGPKTRRKNKYVLCYERGRGNEGVAGHI